MNHLDRFSVALLLVATSFFLAAPVTFAGAQTDPVKPQAETPQENQQDPEPKSEPAEKQDQPKSDSKQGAEQEKQSDKSGAPESEQKSDDNKADQPPAKKPEQPSAEKSERPKRNSGFFSPWNQNSTKSSKRDDNFVSVFEPVVASMEPSTVRIFSGKNQIALGTVVDSNGLILTKASEIRREMTCRINGKDFTPEVVGIHPETDLALLKVDQKSLNVVQWSDQPTPALGRWVASPKAEDKQPAVGIISTDGAREIPPSRPFIGIEMRTGKDGVRITKIVNKSPAELAGLQVADLIYEIEGQAVKTNIELIREIGQYDVGDRITVSVIRFGEEMKLKLTLAERDKISPESQRSNQQNSMGSKLSRRRKDFPKAFQHDSMLNSNTCGGPIVDLSGKAIGINIARDGRVSSLALPVETVLPIIEKLKTGDLAPAVVNAGKIAAIEAELNEIASQLEQLPEKKSVLNNRYNAERARQQEIQRMIDDLEKRQKEVTEKAKSLKSELDDVRKKLRSGEKVRDKLKSELDQLKTGSSR